MPRLPKESTSERDRKAKELEETIAQTKSEINFIDSSREQFEAERAGLQERVKAIIVPAFSSNGAGEALKAELVQVNARILAVDGILVNLSDARRDLAEKLKELDKIGETQRREQLQIERDKHEEEMQTLVIRFEAAMAQDGELREKIYREHCAIAEIDRQLGDTPPRWTLLARDLAGHALWRLGLKCGSRGSLPIFLSGDSVGPTGAWIQRQTRGQLIPVADGSLDDDNDN